MSSSTEPASEDQADHDLVPATSYVPPTQYEKWTREANERDISISVLISSMVELGLNDVETDDSELLSETIELRRKLAEARDQRDEAVENTRKLESQEYVTGLGKIKDLIIENPGIERREIQNHVAKNAHTFTNEYLNQLEFSSFYQKDGRWYPPEEVESE